MGTNALTDLSQISASALDFTCRKHGRRYEYADGHDMEDWDFEDVLVETDVRGYLYEPQYSDEQLRAME